MSATLSVLTEVGLYFGPESPKCAFKKLCCVHFNANQGDQGLVQSPRDWKIPPKFLEIDPKLINHDARKAVSATLSVLN